jgi:hypothetical protein
MKKFLFTLFLANLGTFLMAQEPVTTNVPEGWWQIPKTSTIMKIGGYVKLDVIHDFNPINSPDYFDVSKIPTDSSKGQSTHLNIKETRLFMDVKTPSKVGELRFYVEGDFYGTSGAFRLRHAFAEIGKHWLVGQYWSNFMDENIIPPSLDFEKPAAYAFERHPMVRWKTTFANKSYVAFAIEEPNINAQSPMEPGKFESPLPDLTGRYRFVGSWGHVQLSFFGAMLQYRYAANDSVDNLWLAGGNISGSLNMFKRDKLNFQGMYGPGASRYRSGLVAGLDQNGNLEAITGMAITVSYQHYWTPVVSSLVVFNHGIEQTTAGQPASDVSTANYMLANVIWNVTPSLFVGAEYLRGKRQDISDATGVANRIQLSARYSFNMQ